MFSVTWVGELYVTLFTVAFVTVAPMWLNGRAGAGRFAPGSKKPEPEEDVAVRTTLPVPPPKLMGLAEQPGVAGGGAFRRPTRTA